MKIGTHKMRVLWPHPFSPDVKNAAVFMSPLIDPLKKQGIEVVLFYTGDIKGGPIQAIKTFANLWVMAKTCDIIHAQYGSLCGLVTGLLPGRKILSLRGSDLYPIWLGKISFRVRLLLSRVMTASSLYFYNDIIVMSHDMKQMLDKHIRKFKVTVLPDGINLEIFFPMDKSIARKMLDLPLGVPCVLFTTIDRHNPIKRKHLADEAVEYARKSFPSICMLVPQNVDHMRMVIYVNASDLILSTSTHEGWPNCIKEALACDIPFVATNVSDLKEVADRNPACRVVAADSEKLGQAIIEVLNDSTHRHLRHEVQSMELNACATVLRTIYEDLLARES